MEMDENVTEEDFIRKFKIMYGKKWPSQARPHELKQTLFFERDYCPYCGKSLRGNNPHIDHMNPLVLGGEDSYRNCIYVCQSCNLNKKVKSFLSWLELLPSEFKKESREIYIKKMGRQPEDFIESSPNIRAGDGVRYELFLNDDELRRMKSDGEFEIYEKERAITGTLKLSDETLYKDAIMGIERLKNKNDAEAYTAQLRQFYNRLEHDNPELYAETKNVFEWVLREVAKKFGDD